MLRQLSRTVIGAGLALSFIGWAFPAQAGAPRSSDATVGAQTSVPYGWIDFCNRYAPDCDGPTLPAVDIELSPKAWSEVNRINRQVNDEIAAVTDMDHWGVVDRWDYPTDGKGDCEDYALFKRKLLIKAGFPRQALLMTVVRDHQGEGHAILTLKTNHGEFALDNLSDQVKPWTDTGYKFVKRQSQENPNSWVSIGIPSSEPLFTAR